MENELALRQFDEIERKVVKLIEICRTLETTKTELENTIQRLERELQKKADLENSFVEERDLIRTKIDGLLTKLENINEIEQI